MLRQDLDLAWMLQFENIAYMLVPFAVSKLLTSRFDRA